MTSRGLFRAVWWVAALALGAGAGCDSASYDPVSQPCRCSVEQCGASWCGFELRLHGSCTDEVPLAEILIDGHLEQGTLQPGETLFPCTRTPPGETSEVTVRGGAWIWGPLRRTCKLDGNNVHTLIFECSELEGSGDVTF